MTDRMDFARVGAAIAQRMRELQLTNAEIARRARVDRSRIAMLLKGEPWSMRPDVIAKIEAALGLKVGAIAALGAGRPIKGLLRDESATGGSDLVARIDVLERELADQRELLEMLVERRRDDARFGPSRGVRR